MSNDMEPVAFYLPDDNTRPPIYDDGWSQWIEWPDRTRVLLADLRRDDAVTAPK